MQKRRATTSKENSLSKPIVQRTATPRNRSRWIVALEKVAGSSPFGHPLVCRGNSLRMMGLSQD